MTKAEIKLVRDLAAALKECQSELYSIHSKYGDKANAEDHSIGLQMAKAVLKDYQ